MPFNPTLPTWLALNACNDTTASGLADTRTGQEIQGGALVLGDYFDLTNTEARNLSYSTNGILYEGRYRRVLVDSGATASNVKTGTIGLMPSYAAVIADVGGGPISSTAPSPAVNIVTSYDQAIGNGTSVRPVVFLNTVTPGNYCFVQELGTATVLGKNGLTAAAPAVNDLIVSTTSGLVDDPTQSTNLTYALMKLILGPAIDLPVSNGKFRILLQYVPTIQG